MILIAILICGYVFFLYVFNILLVVQLAFYGKTFQKFVKLQRRPEYYVLLNWCEVKSTHHCFSDPELGAVKK